MTEKSKNTVVDLKILRAAALAFSRQLSDRGIRHVLVGGLAVNAYGYERATADADFLVAPQHREEVAGSALGGESSRKTVRFCGIDIDLVFSAEDFVEAAVRHAKGEARLGVPIIGIEELICTKLIAGRAQDQGDIVELLKRGRAHAQKVAAFLRRHRPDLVDGFNSLRAQAEIEGG